MMKISIEPTGPKNGRRWTSEEIEELIEGLEKEAEEYRKWAPTSWNSSGTEHFLKQSQFLRRCARALRAMKNLADVGPPGQ